MFTVRPAVREDCAGILEIYNDAVLHTTATYDYDISTLAQREAWFDDHAATDYPVFVATDAESRIVGWSALNRFRDRAGYRFTTENSVYVAADKRGLGIGRMLLPPLIGAANARGFRAIIAGIDADNDVSVRLHAKFGFVEVARLRQVGFKFGRWLDVIYMELLLPEAK
ncbi:MAG: N-acetyltransferase family protein [Verrucomicrobia bacterium]|nr:N-acetyltransferase family protein [Verrucomicrobiota bacterium]